MKRITFGTLLFLSIISPSLADDTFIIDTNTIKQQALAVSHQQNLDFLKMFDTDGNGKLSEAECAASFDNFDKFPVFNAAEISTLKQRINSAFSRFDKDNDDYLDANETKAYISYIEDQTLSLITTKMDADGNGDVTNDELMLYIQGLPSLEESLKKLNKMTTQLQKAKQAPKKQIEQPTTPKKENVKKDKFSQMDSNDDARVTPNEYVEYMYNHPNNKDMGFSKEDYNNIYNLIDTTKKGYITSQEYNDYIEQQLKNIFQ